MGSGLALTRTSACPATRSRLPVERARHEPRGRHRHARWRTKCVPWFIAPNGPIREARFKRIPTALTTATVHNLFVITGRSDAPGCNIAQPDFLPAGNPLTGQGGNPEHHFPHPDACVWRWPHRSDPRFGDPREHAGQRVAEVGSWASPVTPTPPERQREPAVPTTGPLPASDGRHRTSPFSCSRAKPTTSRWESRTNCSPRSATRPPAVSSLPRPMTPSTLRPRPRPPNLQSGRPLRHRGVCQLHAHAGPAHSGARHAVHEKWTCRFRQSDASTATRLRLPPAR